MTKNTSTNAASVHAAKSVFFGSIMSACNATGTTKGAERRARVRANRIEKLAEYKAELSSGVHFRKGEPTDRRLNAAQTVQKVLLAATVIRDLNDGDHTLAAFVANVNDDLAEGVKPIAERYPWAPGRDAILGWAKEVSVDLTTVAQAFGLEEAEAKVIPSRPGTVEEQNEADDKEAAAPPPAAKSNKRRSRRRNAA